MFLQFNRKVSKSVFSPLALTEGLHPRPSWHASRVQQKKPYAHSTGKFSPLLQNLGHWFDFGLEPNALLQARKIPKLQM